MKVHELITALSKCDASAEVRLLCCDDNPINGDGIEVKGAYEIKNHPDSEVNGVYIDGTVD